MEDKIIIYTDGSALRNGDKVSGCGWACKLMYRGHTKMKSGRDIGKTNNQMEMMAVLMAMRSITDPYIPVEIVSDSKYVVETMNGYYSIKKNQELWDELMEERKRFRDIRFLWVKGHDESQHNIDVDREAVKQSRLAQKYT